ncbi:unnamed protein product [Rotaria socialis]|uniref:Reverse transcriptase domain-containing protein n=1 Tax=Rotaria socialis TaxID=392032 RepID=A0A820ZYR2_9BILA|nr:unnamed protein product [Rotaria socialis]CAF4570338.1 unnamed protein product [Rotaria socialis]
MSSRNYNNTPPPPPPPPRRYIRRLDGGGVLGANQYNNNNGANQYNNDPYYNQYNRANRYYNNQFNNGANQYYNNRANQYYNRGNPYYNRNSPYYRRNIYYNRNYRPQQRYANPYDVNRPQGRFILSTRSNQIRSRTNSNQQRRSRSNRPNSRNNRQRSQSRQQLQQQRRRGPRQLHLNDFMPAELREPSPNLPTEFNIAATTATTVPPDALPQREIFARRNTTQPFVVDQNGQDNQQPQPPPQPSRQRQRQQNQRRQRPTVSSYRRRQNSRNNRFAELADENDNNKNDNDPIEIEVDNEPMPFNRNMKNMKNNNNNKKDKNTKKTRLYLEPNRILTWLEKHSPMSKKAISGRGNQAYALASAPIYDEWVRNNYEVQVWQSYLKLATEKKHWAKEVIQRTKRRDNVINTRFIHKKINRLNTNISEANATISDLQTELSTYWMHTTSEVATQRLARQITDLVVRRLSTNQTRQTTVATDTEDDAPAPTAPTIATATTTAIKNHIREPVDRIEKYILDYIHFCTQHVKKMAQTRIQLAKAQMDEFKALEDFEQIATPAQWNIHLILKPKIKLWSTKNKNYKILTKRVELELLPKIIDKVDFSFRVDESIINQDEAQATYDQMRQITKEFRTQAMKLYVQSAARENEILLNEIQGIIEKFPKKENENDKDKDDDGTNAEEGYAAFEEYQKLREQRLKLEIEQSLYFLAEQRVEDNNNNQEEEEIIAPTLQEHQLLKLGPKFIFNDPKTASRRRTTELATLKRKIETRFFEKKVNPGRPVEQFIAELDVLLQNLHNIPNTKKRIQLNITQTNNSFDTLSSIIQSSQSQTIIRPKLKRNYGRTVKRLKYKIHLANTILRKTDKSKVFHLGKVEHYQKKSEEYMEKTKAYQCLGIIDPLPDLIQRTNKYLLDLRLAKWITQKQYEQLSIKPNEAELAHLYYLPKAHKPGTPLRPIISGLKHPTIKISKYLDNLLRPLFDQMALNTTVTSGFELIKKLQEWSTVNMRQDTTFCTIDVTDLYTMVPQIEGVLSLRKMLNKLKLKQVGGLKIETIIRLSRFVMKNNYFSYNGQFYHQVRGGAMGSPLTLTISNCYMYFFERQIINQIRNSGGLYFRYIDDIFISVNWPIRHLLKEVDRWNQFDPNIQLSANIGSSINFLDLHIENQDGQLYTTVYQKPSYEPYYLPFNSVHPLHMKKNIIFTMLLRAIRYCSTFQTYLNDREKLRMALLLNKYPNAFIDEQFNNMLLKFGIDQPLNFTNYKSYRQNIIDSPIKGKVPINYEKTMFIHFTYCSSMKTFPFKFHILWNKYFEESPINELLPVLGTRNVQNLQRRLTHTRSGKY